MLIRFTVENFLSFKDEVEFSMLPGKVQKHRTHVIDSGKRGSIKILKTAAIYGANASGKYNLIKAMGFAKHLIINGTRPKQPIPINPFRFDVTTESMPSRFQFEFRYQGKDLLYGFSLDKQRIYEEWLYEITATSEKALFERSTDEQGETHIEFPDLRLKTKKEREFLNFTAMGTRPNQLFLTETIERGIVYFEDIFNWFSKVLKIIFPDTKHRGLVSDFVEHNFKQALQGVLKTLDMGISSVELDIFDTEDDSHIPQELKTKLANELAKRNEISPTYATIESPDGYSYLIINSHDLEIKAMKLMMAHLVKGQEQPVLLEVYEESDGTQRLLHLIPALLELLTGKRVIIIDELDRSLHPHLSRRFIELFLSLKPEQASQLIVTTHESNLLDLDLLRRDEIWF